MNTLRRTYFWPRTLFGRLTVILLLGLFTTQLLSFTLVYYERTRSSLGMMLNYLTRDVSSAVAILEQVPAGQRSDWAKKLERKNYHYLLYNISPGLPIDERTRQTIVEPLSKVLTPEHALMATLSPMQTNVLLVQTRLHDGSPLTIEILLGVLPLSESLIGVLILQLLVMILITWWAVRVATRPLAHLATAAEALGTNIQQSPIEETGPVEVVHAMHAFNLMQQRIADHLTERVRMLAAISHDLQTPLTRMRLRCEMLDDTLLKEKMTNDLDAMHSLVQEGIAFARDGQGVTESACKTDIDALLDSLTCDYIDSGKDVRLTGHVGYPIMMPPNALRRIITNLLDNALKFGQSAEVLVRMDQASHITIAVCDNGPGIPEAELSAVMQPFYRVDNSRNRNTGGTGLGLAIAAQIVISLRGELRLRNRSQGGLEAEVCLPVVMRH